MKNLFLIILMVLTGSLAYSQTTDTLATSVVNEEPPNMPAEYPGGKNAMDKFIVKTLRYPAAAEKDKIGGKVVVSFIIGKEGDVQDVKVVESVHPLLDEEAIRIIRAMPKWRPAKKNGKPARVIYKLPLTFGFN